MSRRASQPGATGQMSLWDLLRPVVEWLAPRRPAPPAPAARPTPPSAPARAVSAAPARAQRVERPRQGAPGGAARAQARADGSAQERYDAVARSELQAHGIKVRRWRSAMSGVAWNVRYRDGSTQRYIEAPRPKGPMSAAVFLHEVGHHAIGFDVYSPRCLEEFHAWRWSLEAMERHGLNITEAVRHRVHLSLWYAVEKAKRRGIKQIPAELSPYLQRPPRRRRAD